MSLLPGLRVPSRGGILVLRFQFLLPSLESFKVIVKMERQRAWGCNSVEKNVSPWVQSSEPGLSGLSFVCRVFKV